MHLSHSPVVATIRPVGGTMTMKPSVTQRLRELRGERTQQEIAARIGVTPASVSLWERTGRVRRENARAYDDALGANGEVLRLLGYDAEEDRPDLVSEMAVMRRAQTRLEDAAKAALATASTNSAAIGQLSEMVEALMDAVERLHVDLRAVRAALGVPAPSSEGPPSEEIAVDVLNAGP